MNGCCERYLAALKIEGCVINMPVFGSVENDAVRFRCFELNGKLRFLAVAAGQSVVFVTAEFDVAEARAAVLVNIGII